MSVEMQLDTQALEALRTAVRGQVLIPSDEGYEEARHVYNAMIDRRPAAVVGCVDVADVIAAVRFGREQGVDTAIRGGGHNGAGLGTVEDGLVIDLSGMRGVRVDPSARTAQIAGGSLLGDVDHATHAFGLATPAGTISTTGAGGLVLGGGIGHLTRKCGLSIDNLLAADVVLADGSLVRASENENTDLFWALRGGGGNFGVVTSLTMRLHEVGTVVAGPMLWPLESAGDVLRWYRDFIGSAPEDLGGFFAFLSVPPAPPFPEELHLRKMGGIVWCWAGDPDRADEVLAEARAQPGLALDGVQPMPYPVLQSAFDPLYPAGEQWYWRTHIFEEISDDAVERHLEFAEKLPTWKSTTHLYPVDGAAQRVGEGDTPWPYRGAGWSQAIVGVDPDPAGAGAIRQWTIDYWDALRPYASGGGAYVNFMMEEGQDRVRASYGQNYDRLAQIKAKYDPDNFFHVNQNVLPAA